LKPAPFAYAKARSVAHAIDLLAQDEARLLAGGQSLVATLNMRLDRPALLVDINGIPGLDGIALQDGHVEIGALVRHAQAERSVEISSHAPLIAAALPHIGHPAIRNRGTIGGSIAFADPAAELPACLVALGGEMEIVGPQGPRTVKADDFFTALFETALGPRDVLTLMRIPAARAQTRIVTATMRWWALPDARAPRGRASPISALSISASVPLRCARAVPRPRCPAAISKPQSVRCARICIPTMTCRRRPR
jgi:carbon-monoxide dehydrogenase medium subunit